LGSEEEVAMICAAGISGLSVASREFSTSLLLLTPPSSSMILELPKPRGEREREGEKMDEGQQERQIKVNKPVIFRILFATMTASAAARSFLRALYLFNSMSDPVMSLFSSSSSPIVIQG
jgi:hypothetical protein